MHPVLFYALATAAFTITSSIGMYMINSAYSKKNFFDNIQKGISDANEYTVFTLPNQMRVMLITNNQTDISAAAVNVVAGSMQDPMEIQGLAHFLESALVMGSDKYPQSDLYRKILAVNAGNGYSITGEDYTTLGFQVNNAALYVLLDVFSRFFIDPLITQSSLDREIQSIQNEWKNTVSLKNKFWPLVKLLTKPGHPFGKFSLGNQQTLMDEPLEHKINPYIAVRKFYRRSYSANVMNLVIYTNEKQKQRTTELVFEYFTEVVDKQLGEPQYNRFGLPIQGPHFVRLHTDQNIPEEITLFYNFNYTGLVRFAGTLLMEFFQVNFCREQQKSGFVLSCKWQVEDVGHKYTFFILQMKLTQQVMKTPEQVLEPFFARLNHLLTLDKATIEKYYAVYLEIQHIGFNFREQNAQPLNFATKMSQKLSQYFGREILEKTFGFTQFDWAIFEEILRSMRPEVANIILQADWSTEEPLKSTKEPGNILQCEDCDLLLENAKHYIRVKKKVRKVPPQIEAPEEKEDEYFVDETSKDEDEDDSYGDDTEEKVSEAYDLQQPLAKVPFSEFKHSQLYGVTYFRSKISKKILKYFEQNQVKTLMSTEELYSLLPSDFFTFPYIPPPQKNETSRQSRQQRKALYKYPDLLESSNLANLWLVKDTVLRLPKVQVRLLIRYLNIAKVQGGYSYIVLKSFHLKQLFLDLDQHRLLSLEQLEVKANLLSTLEINFQCFSDQVNQITEKIMKLFEIPIKDQKELDFLNEITQSEIDLQTKPLYVQALRILQRMLTNYPKFVLTDVEKIDQIKTIESQLNVRWDVLFYGNIDASKTKLLWSKSIKPQIHQIQQPNRSELPTLHVYRLTKHPITFRIRQKTDGMNQITINYYQGSERNLAQSTYMKIIHSALNFYAYDYLHTQLQLGHEVQVQLIRYGNVDGIAIFVQSVTYDPEELDFYIEESLGYFESVLHKMNERDFQLLVQGVQKDLQQMPMDLTSQTDLVWGPITAGDYQFTTRECMVIALDKVNRRDLFKVFQNLFKGRNSKFSLQLYKQGVPIPTEVLREQDTYARAKSTFIGSEEDLRKELIEYFKYTHKYITEPPEYAC